MVTIDSPTTVHNHYYPAPAPQPGQPGTNQQSGPPPQQSSPSLLGTAAKLALGAGLLGTGAGAGVAIPYLLGAFDKPAVVQPPDIDIPQYGLDLGRPE